MPCSLIALYYWSEIQIKPTKICLLCANGMCKLCIHTRVYWLCSGPGFLSPRLGLDLNYIWIRLTSAFSTQLT